MLRRDTTVKRVMDTWGVCCDRALRLRSCAAVAVRYPQAHVWFKGIDWDNIHRMEAPFRPQLRNAEDTRHFDEDIPAEVRVCRGYLTLTDGCEAASCAGEWGTGGRDARPAAQG